MSITNAIASATYWAFLINWIFVWRAINIAMSEQSIPITNDCSVFVWYLLWINKISVRFNKGFNKEKMFGGIIRANRNPLQIVVNPYSYIGVDYNHASADYVVLAGSVVPNTDIRNRRCTFSIKLCWMT